MMLFSVVVVTSSNNDMMKIGNTFLQLKLVLDKGVGNEEVFMGESDDVNVGHVDASKMKLLCDWLKFF